MARIQLVIHGVLSFEQNGVHIFTFVIEAEALLQMGVLLRFGEHPEGVNRKLTVGHAKSIAKSLKDDPGTLMMDPIRGDLRSGGDAWVYDPRRATLTGVVESDEENRMESCYFIIDDGQHRFTALELLDGENRKKWKFLVTATMGLPKPRRLDIFQLHELEKKIDKTLTIRQRGELGVFRSRGEEVAFLGALAINERQNSPLRARVWMEEGRISRADRERGVVPLKTMLMFLKPVGGRSSNLHGREVAEQTRIIVDWFRASAAVWPYFGDPGRVLGSPLAYGTVLRLLSHSRHVNSLLARDYSYDNIVRVLMYGKGFKWEARDGSHTGATQSANHNTLAERLDTYIRDAEVRAGRRSGQGDDTTDEVGATT